MEYYEIYPGGEVSGEIVIETCGAEDENGIIVLTTDEYEDSFSAVGRERRCEYDYHEDYEITENDGMVAIYPNNIDFDGPEVRAAIAKAKGR